MKKGFKFSEEYKTKKKEAYRGFTNSGSFKKGNVPWDKGIKRPEFSKEWKEKLRIHSLGNKSHTGEVHDDAYKKRMRDATKDIPKSEEMKKKVRIALTGKPKTEEHKQKLRGENNWRWNPDREEVRANNYERSCAEYKWWSKAVKERDGNKCKINNKDCCGKVVAHHILGYAQYPELRYEINNGITLCEFHHPTTRKKETEMVGYFNQLLAQTHL
jgi:hypothetical protein